TVVPGCTFREVLRQRMENGSFGGNVDEFSAEITSRLATGQPYSIARKLNNGRTVSVSYRALDDGGGGCPPADITRPKSSEDKIQYLAHYDALTSLANRNLFRERLVEFLARLHRMRTAFAVFLLDLDRFKAVNDTLGHQAGDALLKAVSERIKDSIREV